MLACRAEGYTAARLAQLEPVKSRALLVADEPYDSSVSQQALRRLGFVTVTVPTPRQALACLVGDSFSVVVLDVSLPEVLADGTLLAIADAAEGTPIVILCGLSTLAERLCRQCRRHLHVLDRNDLDLARLTAVIRLAAAGDCCDSPAARTPRRSWSSWPTSAASRPPTALRRDRAWSRCG